MRRLVLFHVLLSVSILWCPAATAGAPDFVAYSGRLTDGTAWGESMTLDLTLSIWDMDAGGTELWMSTFSSVPVEDGFFSVELGLGTQPATGLPLKVVDVFIESGPVWLSLAVGGDPPLSPRQPVGATPYAAHAGNTDRVSMLDLDGLDGRYVDLAGDTMLGALALPADGLTVGDGQLVLSGGSLGVGVADWIGARLHVDDDSDGWLAYLRQMNPAGNGVDIITHGGSSELSALRVRTNTLGEQSDALWVGQNGNVGIGTAIPDSGLHVFSPDSVQTIKVASDATGTDLGEASLVLDAGPNSDSILSFTRATDWRWRMYSDAIPADDNLVLDSNAVQSVMTWDRDTGHVGIGSQPRWDAKLWVFDSDSGVAQLVISSEPGEDFAIRRTSEMTKIMSSFGGPLTARDMAFLVHGSAGEVMRLSASGKVGIGKTDPNFPLDVAGTINASGCTACSSDARIKREVRPIANALGKVLALTGVSFRFDGRRYQDLELPEGEQIGLIAQEVEEVLPEVVTSPPGDGLKSVKYANLVAVLIEAVKDQQGQIDHLRDENDALRARLDRIEALVAGYGPQPTSGEGSGSAP